MNKYKSLKEYGFGSQEIFEKLNPGSVVLITDYKSGNHSTKEIGSYVIRINSEDNELSCIGITILSDHKDELGLSWRNINNFKFKIIKEVQ